MTTTVAGCGWELHCTTGKSDKFYRVLALDNWTIVRNFGRNGQAGQFHVTEHPDRASAIAAAHDATNTREEHGYYVTQDFVEFVVPADAAPEAVAAAFLRAAAEGTR